RTPRPPVRAWRSLRRATPNDRLCRRAHCTRRPRRASRRLCRAPPLWRRALRSPPSRRQRRRPPARPLGSAFAPHLLLHHAPHRFDDPGSLGRRLVHLLILDAEDDVLIRLVALLKARALGHDHAALHGRKIGMLEPPDFLTVGGNALGFFDVVAFFRDLEL